MKHLLWTSSILLVNVFISQAASQGPNVTIEPSEQVTVRVGQNVTILCKIETPISTCRVEIDGVSLILFPGQPADDGIAYFGKSLDAGQCGVRITSVKENYDGIFKCALLPKGDRFEKIASTKIVVAYPPSRPELSTSPGSRGNQTHVAGENLTISCRVRGGRPSANISLFLDDEPIGNEERVFNPHLEFVENSWVVKNVSRVLNSSDNGKTLRCVVDHIALDQPLNTSQQLEVYFPPQSLATISSSGYVIGEPGIVNVTVLANPRPNFTWYIDEKRIDDKQHNQSSRFEILTAVELGKGLWGAALKINSMQKTDSEKNYTLEARNELGEFRYQVVLPQPTTGLIGRTCTSERDCATVDKNSYCNTTRKRCTCNSDFVASDDNQRCLAGVRYNHSGCEISKQCLISTENTICDKARVCICHALFRYASGECWPKKAIGNECRTDNDCLNGMEEGHGPVQCAANKCACAKGFEVSEGKCQPMKHSNNKSGGIRLSGLSVLAMAYFLLLPSVL